MLKILSNEDGFFSGRIESIIVLLMVAVLAMVARCNYREYRLRNTQIKIEDTIYPVTKTNNGDDNAVMKDLNKAIECDPKYVNAYYNRGNTWGDKGEHDRAEQDYIKAIGLNCSQQK